MNPHVPGRRRRLLIALTVAAALITTGCTAGTTKVDPSQYRTIPAASGKPVDGGVVTIAMTPGLAPNYIFPYPPAAANGAVIGNDLMWRTLYRADADGKSNPDTSLASAPAYSDEGRTVTIAMKKNSWSNGKPVTAGDVVFSLAILKAAVAQSAANWAFYTPGQFPDGVTATAQGSDTVVFTLEKAYNPAYLESLLQQLVVIPSADWSIAASGGPVLDYTDPANASAIYTVLTGQSADQSTFATNPLWQVVNGPFSLKSFEPTTGSFSLTPNKAYTGPGKHALEQVDFKAFTSAAAIYNQYQAGTITVGRLDSSYSSKIEELQKKGYNVYAAPAPARSDPLVINFANTTGGFDKIIAQPYVRQALQHLVDQPGYIKSRGVYNGAASENYATVGLGSVFPPDFGDKAPYPFDPKAAEKLLTAHGWKVDKAGTTCEKPGAGSDRCGEGIAQGQRIAFTLASASSPSYVGARDLAFSSEAKKLGIDVKVVSKSLNYLYENYTNPGAPANKNEWAMQDTGPLVMASYPTANGVFNTDGSFNLGSYSSPEADKAIEASVFGSDPKALSAETTLLSKDLPVLFLPTPDNLIVWKNTLSGPPDTFEGLLKFIYSPEQWSFTEKQKQ